MFVTAAKAASAETELLKKFEAIIKKIGINPVVDPPENVLIALFKQAGKSKGPIPVRGTLNGAEFVQTLVKYKGAWRLYVNGPMLKASGVTVGNTAKVQVEFDPLPRETPVPPLFAAALKKDRIAKSAFNGLAPSRQKEILRYLGSLKSRAAIDKNLTRLIKNLRGDDGEPAHISFRERKR